MKKIKVNGKVIGKEYGKVLPLSEYYYDDSLAIGDPHIIYDGKIYHMWYSGFNGKNIKIFYATSKDGKRWIKHDIVINTYINNKNNNYHIYEPSVIYNGKNFKMWYTRRDGISGRIYYTTSEDGINWKNHSIAIPLGNEGESDSIAVFNPNVIYDGNVYKMWYIGFDGCYKQLHYATSIDGVTWKKHGIILLLNNDNKSGDINILNIIFNNNIYKMWYNINDETFYTTSEDGINWKKNSISLLLNSKNDLIKISNQSVIYDSDTYKIWYTIKDNKNIGIYYTELSELILK